MDATILSQLMDAHGPGLVLYARQICPAPEDVVQEAFVKLASQAKLPDHPLRWLYTVVRHRALSVARAESRRHRHERTAASWRQPVFERSSPNALEGEEVARALEQLPLSLREMIVAHIWGGLTFEDIAALAGCSSSTAHRRYQEGLAILRERLEEVCPIPENKKS